MPEPFEPMEPDYMDGFLTALLCLPDEPLSRRLDALHLRLRWPVRTPLWRIPTNRTVWRNSSTAVSALHRHDACALPPHRSDHLRDRGRPRPSRAGRRRRGRRHSVRPRLLRSDQPLGRSQRTARTTASTAPCSVSSVICPTTWRATLRKSRRTLIWKARSRTLTRRLKTSRKASRKSQPSPAASKEGGASQEEARSEGPAPSAGRPTPLRHETTSQRARRSSAPGRAPACSPTRQAGSRARPSMPSGERSPDSRGSRPLRPKSLR